LNLESPLSTSLLFQVAISGLTDPSVQDSGTDPVDSQLLLYFGRVAPGLVTRPEVSRGGVTCLRRPFDIRRCP
jgi:hypothetical protein